MQAGNAAFPFPSPHHPYHIPYHAPLPGPQDHELKKQYLTLLPPQQIIEICLNFDIHVPLYVKSTIWPPDINAAIAALQKTSPPTTESPIAEPASKTNGLPAMGSLGESSDAPASTEQSGKPDEHQPPDTSTSTPGPSSQPSSVPPEQLSTQTPQPQPQPQSQPQQPPYPHQPYGYAHPQSAYPHAPYYQHPPPGYPYPPGSYPPYQMPGYPQPSHPPGFSQPQPNSPFTNAPLTHPPQQPQQPVDNFNQHISTDDLPSYEEMIAEALQDSDEPEGCAPKDLFNWMASRYPLQQNFRPSASQALQKAFKRGRFQKSSSGKYRINATWEGGNTSRRTTRRPQTQVPSAPSGPPTASPFTHAPLVHHQQQSQTPTSVPNQPFQAPYAFPYGHPQPGYPGFPRQPQQPAPAPATAPATDEGERPSHSEGDAADAYEAAQNILKAINFGGLLELPAEEDEAAGKSTIPQAPVTEILTSSTIHPMPTTAAIGVDVSTGQALETNGAGATSTPSGNPRAELQAQLALLAAQLAELVQTDDEDVVPTFEPPQPLSEPPLTINHPQLTILATSVTDPLPVVAEPPPPFMDHLQMEEEEEDSDDDDMEEVI